MSRAVQVSELFFSLEGEAQFTFHPTVYVRFARCNFKCPLFNNPERHLSNTGYAKLDFKPEDFRTIQEMPTITRGCDSQYSVNPAFAHTWTPMTSDQIIDGLEALLPATGWVYNTGLPVILSLTGGEPTLLWKMLPDFINHPRLKECRHILVETNGTVPFKDSFLEGIHRWLAEDPRRVWTWSNSPKLSNSGEEFEDAIRPEILLMQQSVKTRFPAQVNQYVKFVVNGTATMLEEVRLTMDVYHQAGLRKDTPVWLMPMACTDQQQNEIARKVVEQCMETGYLYSHRIQNVLWENAVGR